MHSRGVMDLKTSLSALNGIFPQVDQLILKAVVLEHLNDVDAAVQFILNEVIPNQKEQIADMELHREGGSVNGAIAEDPCHSAYEKLALASSYLSDCVSISHEHNTSEALDEITLTDLVLFFDLVHVKVESSGKESTDSLPLETLQDTIDLSGFNKDNASLSCSWTSSSTQIVKIDTLEGLVWEAKKEKQMLIEAMELIRSLSEEAGREEGAAQRAKEEAAKGGLDILCKVEELRKMQERAKETNDMNVGEVYGERGILAIEARELRFRLEELSAEKDKAFCTIKELQENLQARIDTAKKEKKAAEEETVRKEENARKVLSMEEAMMAKLSQYSLELEKEAENNTKLRECLIECGHMVDVLKGAVSVLSEDVKLLKEQMNGDVAAPSCTEQMNGDINLASPDRCEDMDEHLTSSNDNISGDINLASPDRCEDVDEHLTSSNDNISGSCFPTAPGTDIDIIESRFSTRSDSRYSQDAEYLHSSPGHTIDNEEMDYITPGAERPITETDTEFNRLSPRSSNCSVESEEQQYLKTGSDVDGWQILDEFGGESRNSVSGHDSSANLVKTTPTFGLFKSSLATISHFMHK